MVCTGGFALAQIKLPPYFFNGQQNTGEVRDRPGTWRFSNVVKNRAGAGRRLYLYRRSMSTWHPVGVLLTEWSGQYCKDYASFTCMIACTKALFVLLHQNSWYM